MKINERATVNKKELNEMLVIYDMYILPCTVCKAHDFCEKYNLGKDKYCSDVMTDWLTRSEDND